MVMRAEGFVFRHDMMYRDLAGSGSLFLKPFPKRAPFGK